MTATTAGTAEDGSGVCRPLLYRDRSIVAMSDVDAAGIIYYATPLRWAEKLFTTWIHSTGHSHRRMFGEGIATPAVHVTVDYRSHIALDDEVALELTASRIGTTAFTLCCEAFVGGSAAAVEVQTTHVYTRYVHPSYAAAPRTQKEPIPAWLREELSRGLRA